MDLNHRFNDFRLFERVTVYDMNKVIQMQNMGITDDEHLYIYGAMQLYLDFINLFIRLIELFGKNKD